MKALRFLPALAGLCLATNACTTHSRVWYQPRTPYKKVRSVDPHVITLPPPTAPGGPITNPAPEPAAPIVSPVGSGATPPPPPLDTAPPTE